MAIHTAKIESVSEDASKKIEGTFNIDFETGNLNFNCSTQNVEFIEVKNALIKVRDEIQRQIDNERKCPFYQSEKKINTDADLE